LFITGTRADFGKVKPLMRKIEESENFECYIFATGMHTLWKYGLTYTEIKKEKFKHIFTYINQDTGSSNTMDIILSNTIEGISRYIHENPVDMIVVHGDRVETLAGAIVGALNNVLVAHIEGGELSGTIDGLIRHATSKLSHLHFVSNIDAKKRLIQMGEVAKSIFVIGSPDVDIMISDTLPSLKTVKNRYGISFNKYGVFIYHPVTTELNYLETNINAIVDALEENDLNLVIIYPNNDMGGDIIFKAIKRLENTSKYKLFPSLRFEYFLTLLKNAYVVIGNSSVGIRESPVYGIPSINIGTRQERRVTLPSVINVKPDKQEILAAFKRLPLESKPAYPFGKGNSADKFMKIIKKEELWETPCQKPFQDLD
jgi:UDP-N-acetylglucosamine 2-epimerase (hydrolysing)